MRFGVIGAVALVGALAVAVPATAQIRPAPVAPMSVQTFLDKVDVLKKQGVMAMFSPDVALIKREMQTVSQQMQTEKKAREAAGKPPIACPPTTDGRTRMGADEFLAALRTIPPARRGMSMKDGLTRVLVAKYPCPKK